MMFSLQVLVLLSIGSVYSFNYQGNCFGSRNNLLKNLKTCDTQLYMAGFGSKKDVKPEKKIPDSDAACACGSGKSYVDCCLPLHDNKQEASNLVQIVRGRFSALNYGIASYIIKTTHPDSKEYVSKDDDSRLSSKKSKFTIWEREVKHNYCYHSLFLFLINCIIIYRLNIAINF